MTSRVNLKPPTTGRTSVDRSSDGRQALRGRLRRAELWLVGTGIAAVAIAAVAALVVGGEAVLQHLLRLSPALLAGLLGLSAANYAIRSLRWHLFGRRVGIDDIGLPSNAIYYVAGFSMTVTPGRMGELLRLWFMKRRHGYRYDRTLSLLVADRLSDMVAVLTLCLFGVLAFPDYLWAALLLALGVVVLVLAVLWPGRLLHLLGRLYARIGLWPRLFGSARRVLRRMRQLGAGSGFLAVSALAVVGWLCEALALWWLLQAQGADVSLPAAVFVFTFGIIAGALTMLPGGMGGTEAGMVTLLAVLGVDLPTAVATTIVIRITTLWFAVAVGFLALPVALRLSAPRPAAGAA